MQLELVGGVTGYTYSFPVVRSFPPPQVACVYVYYGGIANAILLVGETEDLRAADDGYSNGRDLRSRCLQRTGMGLAYWHLTNRKARIAAVWTSKRNTTSAVADGPTSMVEPAPLLRLKHLDRLEDAIEPSHALHVDL